MLVKGIGKVMVAGKQNEQVIVEVSREKLANFGIAPQQLVNLLQTQNAVSDAGRVQIGEERIRLQTSGEFQDVAALADLMISNPAQKSGFYYAMWPL